jgi:cytochrome c-type biogenesis protein
MDTKRDFWLSTCFSLGILVMIGLIGLVTSLMGRLMGDVGSWVEPAIGVIFILAAFFITDILKTPNLLGNVSAKGRGAWAALSLGFLMGIALGPCSFAFIALILGIVFSSVGLRFIYALGLLLAYIIGHSLVIILGGTFAGRVQRYLNWINKSKGTKILRYVCALLCCWLDFI